MVLIGQLCKPSLGHAEMHTEKAFRSEVFRVCLHWVRLAYYIQPWPWGIKPAMFSNSLSKQTALISFPLSPAGSPKVLQQVEMNYNADDLRKLMAPMSSAIPTRKLTSAATAPIPVGGDECARCFDRLESRMEYVESALRSILEHLGFASSGERKRKVATRRK